VPQSSVPHPRDVFRRVGGIVPSLVMASRVPLNFLALQIRQHQEIAAARSLYC
jgi:hypothetical protein